MRTSFSSRIPSAGALNALALLAAGRRAAGLPVVNFSESNPTRVGLPDVDGEGILAALRDPLSLSYRPDPRGLVEAREALTARYASKSARDPRHFPGAAAIGPERLFLCASTSEAYAWLFKLLCDPGEAVLVPKPGYPLFDYLAGLEAVEARPYRLEYSHPSGWRIDLDSVEAALRGGGGAVPGGAFPGGAVVGREGRGAFSDADVAGRAYGRGQGRAKAIVLINPNNPTGSYIRASEREAIIALCDRYGAAIIADEVFFDFPLEAGPRSSLAGESRVLTFTLDGLSKLVGLPQMKLGWIAASGPPAELADALGRLEIIADAYLSAGTPAMRALPKWLEFAPAFAEGLGSRLALNLAALKAVLEGNESPHRILRCEGGWSALIESPRLESEEGLALGLLREKGLSLHPGYFFDMEREAFFSASLILEPQVLEAAARSYLSYFEGLMSDSRV